MTAYIVHWVQKQRENGVTWQAIANGLACAGDMSVSTAHLIGMCAKKPRHGARELIELLFAHRFFKGSIGACRKNGIRRYRNGTFQLNGRLLASMMALIDKKQPFSDTLLGILMATLIME